MTTAGGWAETHLGYAFSEEQLLDQALTHRSASALHNERLEFLGDAVLGSVISNALYLIRPDDAEGDLTRLRATLVRRETLAEIARELELGSQLRLGPGERRTGGGSRASVLANALEATLGAVFVDGGYPAAERTIRRIYDTRLNSLPDPEDLIDPKTKLQEALQARQIEPPDYSLTSVTGPAHAQSFEVVCRIAAVDLEVKGSGSSRRRAEQDAAQQALKQMSSG